MTDTQKTSEEGKDNKPATPETDSNNGKQFSEEQEFTDTITGNTVKAYSTEDAVQKLKDMEKKDNK